jgi:hypothetical protein
VYFYVLSVQCSPEDGAFNTPKHAGTYMQFSADFFYFNLSAWVGYCCNNTCTEWIISNLKRILYDCSWISMGSWPGWLFSGWHYHCASSTGSTRLWHWQKSGRLATKPAWSSMEPTDNSFFLSQQLYHMQKDKTLSSISFGFGVIRWDKFLMQIYCPCKSKFCVKCAVLDRHHSAERSCFWWCGSGFTPWYSV